MRRVRSVGATWRDRLGGPGRDEVEHAAVLETAARSLRGGLSLAAALDEAAYAKIGQRASVELRGSLGRLGIGGDLSDVLEAWVSMRPCPSRVVAGAALGLGAELGGAQARSLDGAAAGLRDQAEVLREVRALTSQARASAAVLVLAPLAFAGYSWLTDGRVGRVMFTTPLGWTCLGVGAVLDGVGAAWMARLVERVR
jgi:tight adherence protein B